MGTRYSEPVTVAREYYNSQDADTFYSTIWGGEDIHIGLYESAADPIREASRRTVERMAAHLVGGPGLPGLSGGGGMSLSKYTRIIDIGAGYGGAARYLAEAYGTPVVALNLSEVENQRDREINQEQGLEHLIEVVDASFEEIPFDDKSFSVVWSQDALLHSGDRRRVLEEATRVLAPRGRFVFTDPMMADDCPRGVLQPILDRIHLETLGSPGFYRRELARLGCREIAFEDQTNQLVNHYSRVLSETEAHSVPLSGRVSEEYLERMKRGLRHWIDGGANGHLVWGIFHFEKE